MTAAPATIRAAVRARFGGWLAIVLGSFALYYAGLLAALVVRFEGLPNYVVAYDWPGNVVRIICSTPSLADIVMIVQNEWLLEVGRMNMSFGNGISEWSLTLVPPKMAVILALGMLIATTWALAAARTRACEVGAGAPALAPTLTACGLGTGLVALTGATMTWVVCCATPSWIVGLAMLGLGVSTANWLEPAGPYLTFAGFALLGLAVAGLAREPMPSHARFARRMPSGLETAPSSM